VPTVSQVQRDQQPQWVHAYRRAVGERIRARRVAAGATQIDLCYVTGVDRTTYQRFESGVSDPHLGELTLIAEALGTTVEDLVGVPFPPR
jgi:transcriptional regulator with XRE-family HTH domain